MKRRLKENIANNSDGTTSFTTTSSASWNIYDIYQVKFDTLQEYLKESRAAMKIQNFEARQPFIPEEAVKEEPKTKLPKKVSKFIDDMREKYEQLQQNKELSVSSLSNKESSLEDLFETDILSCVYNSSVSYYLWHSYRTTKNPVYLLALFIGANTLRTDIHIKMAYQCASSLPLDDSTESKKKFESVLNRIYAPGNFDRRIRGLLTGIPGYKASNDTELITDSKNMLEDVLPIMLEHFRNGVVYPEFNISDYYSLLELKRTVRKYNITTCKLLDKILSFKKSMEFESIIMGLNVVYMPYENMMIACFAEINNVLSSIKLSRHHIKSFNMFLEKYNTNNLVKNKKSSILEPVTIDGKVYDKHIINQAIEDSLDDVLLNVEIEEELNEEEES